MAKKNRKIKGKHQAFTARITEEARDALEKEAAYNGRTLAAEVDLFIMEGTRARLAVREELEGRFALALEDCRRIVLKHGGLPPSKSAAVRDAVALVVDRLRDEILKLGSLAPEPDLKRETEGSNPTRSGRILEVDTAPEAEEESRPVGRRILELD